MRFTIITGAGRCGTSAIVKFLDNTKKYRIDKTRYDEKIRAGLESHKSNIVNFAINSSLILPSAVNSVRGSVEYLYNSFDIVKTPTFFYFNTYHVWNKLLKNKIQVILLKRNPTSDIFKSVKKITEHSDDWSYYDTEEKIEKLYSENIYNLEKNNIPYITLDFPKFTNNYEYLFYKMKKLEWGLWDFTKEEIKDLSEKTFDNSKVSFNTEKINLRTLNENDLNFLLEVRNHPSTRKFLENDSIFTLEESKKWYNKLSYPWKIIEVNGKKIGYLRINGDEIGCDIHPSYRRKGYARKAYNEYLKDKDFATLWVFEDNFAKTLYQEIGFVETGENKMIRNKKYLKMVYVK